MTPTARSATRDERLAALLVELTERRRDGPVDLDAVARQNPDLADELRALWAAAMIADEFARESPPVGRTAETFVHPPTFAPRAPESALPRPCGDCALIEEIGRGGMGVV